MWVRRGFLNHFVGITIQKCEWTIEYVIQRLKNTEKYVFEENHNVVSSISLARKKR